MPDTEYVIDAFINAIQKNVEDIVQVDIDNNPIAVRASKSYWIAEGAPQDKWRDYSLPQIAIHKLTDTDLGENDVEDMRWEETQFVVDIWASGRGERRSLAGQVKKGLHIHPNKISMNASGFKVDKMLSDRVSLIDEEMPNKVYRETLIYRVFFRSSGA